MCVGPLSARGTAVGQRSTCRGHVDDAWHAWQVEALKTRAAAKAMVDYMRRVNPQLAQALLDDRDEAGIPAPVPPLWMLRHPLHVHLHLLGPHLGF